MESPRATEAVLGVDLGTSECKLCLVAADGAVVRTAREGYTTHSPRPSWAEQDPADWLKAVSRATRCLLAESGVPLRSIAGLALTSAAHIGVLVDEEGAPVRRALLWNDQRSSGEVADLERDYGETIGPPGRSAPRLPPGAADGLGFSPARPPALSSFLWNR
jgi:xylulokinase